MASIFCAMPLIQSGLCINKSGSGQLCFSSDIFDRNPFPCKAPAVVRLYAKRDAGMKAVSSWVKAKKHRNTGKGGVVSDVTFCSADCCLVLRVVLWIVFFPVDCVLPGTVFLCSRLYFLALLFAPDCICSMVVLKPFTKRCCKLALKKNLVSLAKKTDELLATKLTNLCCGPFLIGKECVAETDL